MTKLIDRLSFPTEYHSFNELKSSLIVLFIVCLSLFILSSILISFDLFLLSKIILMGTMAYEFLLLYLLRDYTRQFIKKIKGKGTKRSLSTITSIIFGLIILLTVFSLIYTMASPNPATENKVVSLIIGLVIILLPTFFWHELVKGFEKKYLKHIKFLLLTGLILSALPVAVMAQPVNTTNQTTNQTGLGNWWTSLTSGFTALQQVSTFFTQVQSFFSTIQSSLSSWFGLEPFQSQVIVIILILIAAFVILKFLSTVVKWVVIILVVWIIIQVFL